MFKLKGKFNKNIHLKDHQNVIYTTKYL